MVLEPAPTLPPQPEVNKSIDTGMSAEAEKDEFYSDYSDYASYAVEGDDSWNPHDWQSYVKPQHNQRHRGGGRYSTEEETTSSHHTDESEPPTKTKKKKNDQPTPEERLRILRYAIPSLLSICNCLTLRINFRDKTKLTNKERKEKNKLEKEVGDRLDKLEASTTASPVDQDDPPTVVDLLGTLAI